MTLFPKSTAHPGTFVRENIIPHSLSVTEAAKRLGIGRPALSNFLNGKSSLSPEMAIRLEKAFGANRKQLLDMQAAYDQQKLHTSEKEVAVRPFVPNFLTIKARQIEDWADSQIEARVHLSVLLRKLVHSTGKDLHQVDFPGYDNAQRKGPDGFVKAGAATPWVPEGVSYWEFGTNQELAYKAERDYNARLASVERSERASSTFVFVTPRNWPGTEKVTWEKSKNQLGDWKAVRVLDASDLEQWLEQSVPAQIWLAEQLELPVSGFETLEQVWIRWANASEPHLTPEIFAPSITAYQTKFKAWLEKPSNKPFVVAADSRDEALAFLACLFDEGELRQYKDSSAVFTSPKTLKILLSSSISFIPIVHSEDVERELVDAHHRLHCIIVHPRNAVDTKADIALDLLGYEAFEKALTAMGMAKDDIDRLARESGRSPTILRRRLSKNAAIKTPTWASDSNLTKILVPIALIGTWHADSKADQEIISYLADQKKYEDIEQSVVSLLRLDDSPVWSVGQYRGVASKIDAMYATATMVTPQQIERFFDIAEYVLSEINPALDLSEEKRWAAAIFGKIREHSDAVRESICETLIILSIHGKSLKFMERLDIDVEKKVADLIRRLLAPLTPEKMRSHDKNLPHYAEAAPNEFLSIIEEDLHSKVPVILGLLKPVDSSFFGAWPSRTGLLWALECLAWKPQNLQRVSIILAQLSQQKINDNWMNKPDASLKAIFRSRMPQTAASIEQRVKALETLIDRYPDVGWEICIEQIKVGPRFGISSYRPRWRSDASGAGEFVTFEEAADFARKALELAISWRTHDEKTLGDLIGSLQGMPEEDQDRVWDLVDEWSQKASEVSKAEVRERIRQIVFTRIGYPRNLHKSTRDRARETYESLQPEDPVIRHGWLFAEDWVQATADDIDKLRRDAMKEIWIDLGFEGIKELLNSSNAATTIGKYVALCILEVSPRVDFIHHCLFLDGDLSNKAEWCLKGFLRAIDEVTLSKLLQVASDGLPTKDCTRLFVCAPFHASTWRLLDGVDEVIRSDYWKRVVPTLGQHSPAEITEMIDRLLEAQRPRAAFHASHMNFKDVETSRLKRLLHDVATVNTEPTDQFKFDRYYISEALNSLNGRAGVTLDEMAQLEFLYILVLGESTHGIPNLEKLVAQSPQLFAQAIAIVYKRRDGGEDPPGWKLTNHEQQRGVAEAFDHLLDHIKKIPGTDENGMIDAFVLAKWLDEVQRICREYARGEVGDYRLGQLLANAPEGENGIWPCKAVCEVMEAKASPAISRGFRIGVYNSRGVHSRTEGGEQERELAMKYTTWAEQWQFGYPFVSRVLSEIAESYEREARQEDSRANISKRLRY